MGQNFTFDFSEYKDFFAKMKQAAGGDFKKQMALFLEGMGFEFLRIVEDEIIRREVVDTRLLLISFHKGESNNVWELNEGDLTLEVGTNVKYAAYVNDGHWTNPKGVSTRFVPRVWNGNKFIYQPGAKTGMLLKQKWVEGRHYWDSAIRIMEKMIPDLIESAMQQWLDQYFQ